MRKTFVLIYIVALSFMLLTFAYAEDKEEGWIQTSYGSYKVDRFWGETLGDYGCIYFLVSYKNTTTKKFTKLVSIRAAVYDADDNMLNMNTRSFFSHEYGTIVPGFEGTLKIPVECKERDVKSVSVTILKAK